MRLVLCCFVILLPAFADDGQKLLSVDHYVGVRSEVPAINGQTTEIYVREVVLAGAALRSGAAADRVVLFVHGAGTPAEVAFDAGYQDYSWMGYLARAGFDVFAMDMTGYGRSTRPWPMNDLCNLVAATCAPSYPHQLTTIASDWNDIGAVVDRLRALRHVDKISLIGWSQGGPRAAGYAAQHQDKVLKLVLLAPAYGRNSSPNPPAQLPGNGAAFNTQSHAEFMANWDRQVGCTGQYDPPAAEAVWAQMLDSDPVGATWGTGVRRAPQETIWGWNQAMAASLKIPVLLVSGFARWRAYVVWRSGRDAEGVCGSGLFVAQRAVGEESFAAVPCVAGMADGGDGGWQADGDVAGGLLIPRPKYAMLPMIYKVNYGTRHIQTQEGQ